jgi:hypothetical protein
MSSYTPLFRTITSSTIWFEDDKTRLLWITMLAEKNVHGVVEASVPGLANIARIPIDDCRKSLEILKSPDPDSRTKEFDGRRIEDVDGGWIILNHEKYSQKARERAQYFKDYRKRKSLNTTPTNTPPTITPTVTITKGEEESPPTFIAAQKDKKSPEEIHTLKLKERSFGKFCIYCGGSPTTGGKIEWYEQMPFCKKYHYEYWLKNNRQPVRILQPS